MATNPTWEQLSRERKVSRYVTHLAVGHGGSAEALAAVDAGCDWEAVAAEAGMRPPSDTTVAAIRAALAELASTARPSRSAGDVFALVSGVRR